MINECKVVTNESCIVNKATFGNYFFSSRDASKDSDVLQVIRIYGSIDKYNECIEKFKSKEDEIAKMAIKQYGSGTSKFIGEALKIYS